jgi:hypothetical protein
MKTLAISALAGFISWTAGLAIQGATGIDPGNLIQFGALGAVLAWLA